MADKRNVPMDKIKRVAFDRSINDWLWEIGENGTFTYSSPQCESLLGYTPEEIAGKAPWVFMNPAEANRLEKLFSEINHNEGFHFLQDTCIAKNGNEVFLESVGSPFFNSNNQFMDYKGVSGYTRVGNHKTRKDGIPTTNLLWGNIPGVIFRYTQMPDGSDSIENISPGSKLIWELSADEIKSDPTILWQQIHPEDLDEFKNSVGISKQLLKKWDHVYRIITPSSGVKWLHGIGSPVKQTNGAVFWDVFVSDITETFTLREEKTNALVSILSVLAKTMASRDPYTGKHEERVTKIAVQIAIKMGLDENRIMGLELASSIHDMGKIQIPAEILSKPAKLSDIEYELIKCHSFIGASFLTNINFKWPISDIILQHHERIDGSGYPMGLVGDEILLEARILGVADTIEAMASHRPYRSALGIDKAAAEIKRGSGTIYDSNVAAAALLLIKEGKLQPYIDG